MDVVKLFCDIDDFCKQAQEDYEKQFPDQPVPAFPSCIIIERNDDNSDTFS